VTKHTISGALAAVLLATLSGGCATEAPPSAPAASQADAAAAPEPEAWKQQASEVATTVGSGVRTGAKAVGRGAVAVGKATATAYQGVTQGFQEPERAAAYGRFPKDYARIVRRHFVRILDYPEDARFRIGKPVKGYMNRGLLLGGGVAWQGYLVDVEVDARWGIARQWETHQYVVRIRDGEVVEAHRDPGMLRRVADESTRGTAKR
jgi:hypothetical protein